MRRHGAQLLTFLLAGLCAAATVRQGTFAAAFTDAAGYFNQARGFPSGEHVRQVPIAQRAFWRYHTESLTSLAARSDLVLGTEVGVYPLGNPVLIAAAQAVGGEMAGFLVAPFFLAVLVACAFAVGGRLAGPRAGLVAAAIVAASPALVAAALAPMSDLPAAACWALAFVMACRPSTSAAAAAGASVAMAIMIRPQVTPIALVPAFMFLIPVGPRAWAHASAWRWRHAMVFGALAALGPALVLWSQAVLYGSPLTPGYPGPWTFFGVEHLATNFRIYPRFLVATQSPVILAGLIAVPWWRRLSAHSTESDADARTRIARGAAAIIALNIATYLLYLPFDHWAFLRFLAPALFAVCVLFGACVVHVGDRLAEGNPRWVLPVVVVAILAVPLVYASGHVRQALMNAPDDRREMAFGHYLAAALPPNALVVTFLHSASVVYYTGKPIVRYDVLDPASFDAVIDTIERLGYVPYLLVEERFDVQAFRERHRASRFAALDWPPRAVSGGAGPMALRAFRDRDAYASGTRWPIDVIGYVR